MAGSVHLLGRALALYDPSKPAALDICSAVFHASCDAALADERFSFLNIPLAGWGLVYFSTLSGAILLARFLEGTFETDALIAGSALTLAGLGAGIGLTACMLLGVAPLCPICLALHAVSLALVFSWQRTTDRPISEQVQRLRDVAGQIVRSRTEPPESIRWQLVAFACVALVALLAYQWVYVESTLRRPRPMTAPDRARIIADFQSSPQVLVPVTNLDPHLGPLTAPVQLVVFESLRCPHCQRLASGLSRLHQQFRDQLAVVYKHYPLSTHCNRQLPADLQPGACEIAWAAEAANQQSSFWPFHDAMLTVESPPSEESLRSTAQRLRLDTVRFDRDRRSDSTRQRVAEDVALGNQLKLPGTPAVFLNGRWVRLARAEVLEILVRHELARVGKSDPLDRAENESGRPGRDGRSVRGGG